MFYFRKSKKIGPFNLTASKSGLTMSGGTKGVRQSVSTSGRKTSSFNLFGWTKRKSRG